MQNSPRILVVEDEADLRQIYAETLKNAGYAVEVSANGEDGIRLMRDKIYDVIFLDVMLPDMNGPEVLKILGEQMGNSRNGKVFVLTNVENDLVKDFCIEAGAAGYLIKTDTTPDKLLLVVQDFLKKNPPSTPAS